MAAYDEELALNFELEVEANEPHRLSLFKMSVQPQSHLRLNERDLIKALKARLDHWVNENRFSGAVLLARNDRVLFRRAYGFSDRTARTPNTLKTRFRVGSVNKVMTAVAILQLVEDGKLALTDTVGKHIKDLENKVIAEKVTIHQLLTHTGGTGDFFGPDFYAKLGELRSLENYLALDPMRKLEFEPGTRCGYSNYGYVLLGIVIERVSGLNYYDYVRQRVYDPAGMDSSDTPSEDQQVRRRSIGYTKPLGSTVWVPNTNTLPMRGSSAGGGLTTVGDLFRFARGLATNELLSPQYTDLLISAKTSKENACPTPFAYGVVDMRDKDGSGWIGLNGAAEGQNAHWKLYPKSGYSIAVLSNLDLPAADRVANFIDRHLAQ
jgi:D-alanyl-D-alanine carboxypeptidase